MVAPPILIKYKEMDVGVASFDTDTGIGAFQYYPSFIETGIELSPFMMPLNDSIYTFPHLSRQTFKGLPGLLADSLPDDFGNAVLNAWMMRQGRQPSDITPLERLQFTGARGMGALEYFPIKQIDNIGAAEVNIPSLVDVAQRILNDRNAFSLNITSRTANTEDISALLSVGTSAGGARPKAVLAFNEDFSEVRSGQVFTPVGFTHYLMKFDGVVQTQNNLQTFGDPIGFGAMEYVYYLIAQQCGITMMPSYLLDEGIRRHFVTQRFDRNGNDKIHTQTLNAIAHIDFNQVGTFSYEELLFTARSLSLGVEDAIQLLRRMIFNIVGRNHDDHSKNFSFMLVDNSWKLAPAYDLAYSYKPESEWVNQHWMILNGKRDHFTQHDLLSLESLSPRFSRSMILDIYKQTAEAFSNWTLLATENGVPKELIKEVERYLRLSLPKD